MTHTPDLTAAAARVATLLRGVSDDQLDGPTPCPAYSVGDLVDHIGGLALAFTWAATKEFPPEAGQPPSGEAARLPDEWRDTFADRRPHRFRLGRKAALVAWCAVFRLAARIALRLSRVPLFRHDA